MRPLCFVLLSMSLTPALSAQEEKKEVTLETTKDKLSYGIGLNVGRSLAEQGVPLDLEKFLAGVQASLSGTEPVLTVAEFQTAVAEYQKELAERRKKQGEANMEAARQFLLSNKKKPGVKVTKSGLQYIVIREGKGQKPTTDSQVSTHYRGKLLSGEVFDQSYESEVPLPEEKPASFGVTQVIPGWTEALQLMKAGSKYRLFIRPGLAYGENGPGIIGSNSLLIFDIELLSVK